MIVGIGLDIVEVTALERLMTAQGDGFEARVFTTSERSSCARRADRMQALAARFAAKEACMKALGTGWGGPSGTGFQQIEVVDAAQGAPTLRLSGAAAERSRALKVARVHVTLSHQPGMAAAAVILEG